MFADFVPGTGRVALSVAISTSLDAAALLNALDRYPFGCSEQIDQPRDGDALCQRTWRRRRILRSTATSTAASATPSRGCCRGRTRTARSACGRSAATTVWLDAYVTDFLTRAREREFEVPAQAFTLALDRLRNFVATAPEPSKNGGRDLAYALYVLARNGAAPVGDLRYIADVKLGDLATPIAKAQIAAALAMLGDKDTRRARVPRRAQRHRAAAEARSRPRRFRLGLARFGGAGDAGLGRPAAQPTIDEAVLRVDAARALASRTSTQEDAWLVLAARALAKQTQRHLARRQRRDASRARFYRSLRADDLAKPLDGEQ